MSKKIITFLIFALFMSLQFEANGSDSAGKDISKNRVRIDMRPKRIKPLDNLGNISAYYIPETNEIEISFPQSEGWAEIAIETPTEGVIFKDRFHSAFEYSAYVGIPTEPWIITVITTQGGEYEGSLTPLK
ncbi:MAG: hypothetical protein NC127_05550 [Muribaculum sp.]|nr:hypothetical protein [Muribaculum sp.]